MTDTNTMPISLDDERLIREGEMAAETYNKSAGTMRNQILPMARGLLAARRRYRRDTEFGHWLKQSAYTNDVIGPDERAALIKIGEHEQFIVGLIRTTTLISPRTIWKEYGDAAKALAVSHHAKPETIPTSIPKLPISAAVAAEIEQPAPPEMEIKEPAPRVKSTLYPLPMTSKLRDLLNPKVADVLLTRFKHSRMFIKPLGDSPSKHVRTIFNYLAERCVQPDYPVEFFQHETWTLQLLYPHLPQKFLEIPQLKTISTLHKYHVTLIETERRFVLTPEFGVTDPPMVAFNKAQSIYSAITHTKNGSSFDQSAVHRPSYASDGGKPPIIVRGTQLWPVEKGSGYGYDDLRCAFNFANDILLTFGEPRDAPMTTKSLKLRHLMSWLPGGYNSTGSTVDGLLKALKDVVQAYSTNANEVMRNPLPSMKKLDETP